MIHKQKVTTARIPSFNGGGPCSVKQYLAAKIQMIYYAPDWVAFFSVTVIIGFNDRISGNKKNKKSLKPILFKSNIDKLNVQTHEITLKRHDYCQDSLQRNNRCMETHVNG